MRKTIGATESSSIYLLGVCATSVLSLVLSLAFRKTDASFAGMSVFNWVGYAVIQTAFFLTVLIYSKVRKIDEIHVAKIHKFTNWKRLVLLPFIGIATILVFLPLANAWTSFLSIIGYNIVEVPMPDYSNVGIYFLSLLLMAVIPAICEELFIRGNVFSGLSTRSTWFGILISALLFSLMHANPVQTVHQFGLGIVLAIIMAMSGSILPCILLHFFNNFVSITLTAYLPQVGDWYAQLGYYNWLVGFFSVAIGLISLVALLYLYHRFGKSEKELQVVGQMEFDTFTIYASIDKKRNMFEDMGVFFKSLFTKQGWRNVSSALSRSNGVEYIGKQQPMIGVWLAIALVAAYWLYIFIAGLL